MAKRKVLWLAALVPVAALLVAVALRVQFPPALRTNAVTDSGGGNPSTSNSGAMPARTEAFVVGEFPITKIVDGDTIDAGGYGRLRIQCVDTEETCKFAKECEAVYADFPLYAQHMSEGKSRPAKFATPMGDLAEEFVKRFFYGVDKAKLTLDDPEEVNDYYGRKLAYVLVNKNGKEVNFNVELVRQGLSPYFSKYGWSRFYHEQFVKAEQEAQAAQVGIWGATPNHYFDYPARLEWWEKRAKEIDTFRRKYARLPAFGMLGLDGISEWLKNSVGKEVTVFGAVSELRTEKIPRIMSLAHKNHEDFSVVCFDADLWEELKPQMYEGEYVYVHGPVQLYKDRPQMVLKSVSQVWQEN